MFTARVFRLIHDKRLSVPILRCFHHEFTHPELNEATKSIEKPVQKEEQPILAGAVQQKYKVFRDDDSSEIFDVEETRARYQEQGHATIEEPDLEWGKF